MAELPHRSDAERLEEAAEALRLIAQHAQLDATERGIKEADRYAVIAVDALARIGSHA